MDLASCRLSPDELERADADGFVVRNSVFSRTEVGQIVEACEEVLAGLVKDRQGNRVRVGSYVFDPDALNEVTIKWEGDSDIVHGIEPLAHLSPPLERWAYDPRLVGPMVDLVDDPDPVLFTEKLNLKRPHHGGENPLHQDFPYWEHFADNASRVATAMLFLDDATLENGTLQVVRGSHRQGKWTTRTDRDGFGNFETDPTLGDGRDFVAVEVEAGSVVFFGAFLVHKSAPNTSDRQRRSLLYSYQPAGLTHARDLLRRRFARA